MSSHVNPSQQFTQGTGLLGYVHSGLLPDVHHGLLYNAAGRGYSTGHGTVREANLRADRRAPTVLADPYMMPKKILTVKFGLRGVLKVVNVSPDHLPVDDEVALLVDHVRYHEHLHAAIAGSQHTAMACTASSNSSLLSHW